MWGTAQPAPITHVLYHPSGKGGSEDPSWENLGVSTGPGTLLKHQQLVSKQIPFCSPSPHS